MLKYKYIFQIIYTEAMLSNSTRTLLWFEIAKMLIAVKKNKLVLFWYNFAHFRSLLLSLMSRLSGRHLTGGVKRDQIWETGTNILTFSTGSNRTVCPVQIDVETRIVLSVCVKFWFDFCRPYTQSLSTAHCPLLTWSAKKMRPRTHGRDHLWSYLNRFANFLPEDSSVRLL